MERPTTADAERVLKEQFGHSAFRPGQDEIIERVLGGVPVLAVMPTGSGKSLCYQLPALLFDGLTVVVSPLIALMNDQVIALKERGIAAAAWTSAESEESRRQILRDVQRRALKLLYVAPERFRSGQVAELIAGRVALFAIDEAHCISEWGHDFRPDYARLGAVIDEVRPERVIALTATATAEVRADILRSLALDGAEEVVTGFDRPNLALSVIEAKSGVGKQRAAIEAIERWIGKAGDRGGVAIVYAATRRRSEEVRDELEESGLKAAVYHAGLDPERRSRAQAAFLEGKVDVIVATTAFGMGVDKANVRVVVHHDVPSSLEGYYQEVGRAGRDGAPAAGVLLWDPADLRFANMRLESSCPSGDAVARASELLQMWAGRDGEIAGGLEETADRLSQELGTAARAALVELERLGHAMFLPGRVEISSSGAPIDREYLDRRARIERRKLESMLSYVERAACRRRFLTDYFGDRFAPERCGMCDRCQFPDRRKLDGEPRTDALKALSCVARMRGRYGKNRVVDVLLGSSAKTVKESGLDQLSTYGLLKEWSRDELFLLFDSMARAGLIATTVEEYPRLRLTHDGARVLKNELPLELDLVIHRWGDGPPPIDRGRTEKREKKRERVALELENPADQALFEALRAWRTKEAIRIKKPPYVVAHDALLAALALLRPTSKEHLAQISGIGPSKLAQYGDEILAVVAQGAG
ncbi:MAG: RecQ family ATP-dependent DNA helicase [Myxococcota bacterium]